MKKLESVSDVIVFSSHSYGSDEVRTTHLMNQFVANKRVFFFESPIIGVSSVPTYFLRKGDHEVTVIQPYLPGETSVFEQKEALLNILKEFIHDENITHYAIWTDTPKTMPFVRKLSADVIVYDCLSCYLQKMPELEKELFEYADVVLTSGMKNKPDKIETPLHDEESELPANVLHIIPSLKRETNYSSH